MCGRFAFDSDQIMPWLESNLDIAFSASSDPSKTISSNSDVRPTNSVLSIIQNKHSLQPTSFSWGIKPSWSKKLIINAQSETVAEKKTFKHAFAKQRCLLPITAWYEWKAEGQEAGNNKSKKQKYYLHSDEPLLMAGIWYQSEDQNPNQSLGQNQTVSLTTQANKTCLAVHHRMPVFIPVDCVERWFNNQDVSDLLLAIDDSRVKIERLSA